MSNRTPEFDAAWTALNQHVVEMRDIRLKDLFARDNSRANSFQEAIDGVVFDYSKQRVNSGTMAALLGLAKACKIEDWREKMLHGQPLNITEDRAALHCALRGSAAKSLMIDGENISHFIRDAQQKMRVLCEDIHNNENVTDIVWIGIGGSDLGPRLVCESLQDFKHEDAPNLHFISNADGHRIARLLKTLPPTTTRFMIASKTFSTSETMLNAHTARQWIATALGESAITQQFYAVTSEPEEAEEFGISPTHILPMRNWIGGRFSVWGMIGFPVAILLGFERFQDFLSGAKFADEHFKKAPLNHNIPILMALISIWNRNFLNYNTQCVVPYAQDLQNFAPYVQQLEMESNGKNVDREGNLITYQTSPIVFGGPGTTTQHALFQMLHQGTQVTPVDFIGFIHPNHDLEDHHAMLLSNMIAQSEALMRGEEKKPNTPSYSEFIGNRPSSTFLVERLDPYHLGMLMALYEHKVFVQGILWNINSFDQWGVELGKKLATPINECLTQKGNPDDLSYSSSTKNLMKRILSKNS